MFLRIARFSGTAAAFALTVALAVALPLPQPSHAQTAPPAAAQHDAGRRAACACAAAKPESKPAEPTPVAPEGITTKPTDAFGEDVTLTAKPIVYIKGSGTWDKAYVTISGALKKVEAYVAKAGLKTDGQPMTIFLATDDLGFDYEAAVPLAEAPKDPPHGEISAGQSPDGRALKFVHRGSYDLLDDTYEAITNYLDDKRLELKNVLIEQYVTDPVTADPKNLVINIFVLVNLDLRHCEERSDDESKSQLPDLSRSQRAEALGRNSCRVQRLGKRDERRVDGLVGELKRAVVMAEGELGAAIDEGLHRLGRVHMGAAHEPARLVGADWQKREADRTVALADEVEIAPLAVPGIGNVIETPARRLDHERGP